MISAMLLKLQGTVCQYLKVAARVYVLVRKNYSFLWPFVNFTVYFQDSGAWILVFQERLFFRVGEVEEDLNSIN